MKFLLCMAMACLACSAVCAQPAAATPPQAAAAASAASAPAGEADAQTITVTGIRLNRLQVESGVLKGRSGLETPFSVTSFDESLVKNLNVRTLNQLLRFDPSAQLQVSDSSFGDFVNIRGFEAGTLYAGLTELVYTAGGGRINLANIERIEVFRGVNALAEGASLFAGIGGTVNQVPKTPARTPITELNLGLDAKSQGSLSVDISRPFAEGRAGARLNAIVQDGEIAVENVSRKVRAATLNTSWEPTRTLRLNGEIGAASDETPGYRDNIGLAAGVTRVPKPPPAEKAYSMPWATLKAEGTRWYAAATWEPSENFSIDAAYGRMRSEGGYVSSFGELINDEGDFQIIGGICDAESVVRKTGQLSVRGRFATGSVQHRPALAFGTFSEDARYLCRSIEGISSNIYRPLVPTAAPVIVPGENPFLGQSSSRSVTAFDDLRIGRVSLLAGVRRTTLDSGTDVATATTPLAAINVFFDKDTTVYLSYAEGLEFGGRAGLEANITNRGELLPARRSKQIEIGAKARWNRLLFTAAVFDLVRPLEYLRDNGDGTSTFVQAGKQRHRGWEARLEGSLSSSLRTIAGVSDIHATIGDNGVPSQSGNRAPGVSRWRTSLFTEYDTGWPPGLTLSSGVIAASSSFVDLDNRLKADGYWQLDVGARYAFSLGGTEAVARIGVENLTDRSYWLPTTYFGLALSSPRTVKTSLTLAF